MSKGGGSSGTTTVTQTNLPEYVEPYLKDVLTTAFGGTDPDTGEEVKGVFTRPLEQYGGERIAAESPQRQLVSEGIEGLVEFGSPYYGETMDLTRELIQQYRQPTKFTQPSPEIVAAMQSLGLEVPTSAVDEYMSPYIENVLEQQKSSAVSDYAQQAAGRKAQAARAGALGGSREAVQSYLAEEGLQSRLAGIEATGRQAAYEQAQQQFERDRTAEMAQRSAAMGGLRQLAGLGAESQASLLERLSQLESVGAAEEGRRQAELDLAYQDFLERRDYPERNLEKLRALISGTPFPTSTSTSAQYQSNMLKDLLGLGIQGYSAYKYFQ